MMYGSYDPRTHQFSYSGAGHEPGFYYHARKEQFEDLHAKGLVLGLSRKFKYQEFEKDVHEGDLIVFLSDGVTECRVDGRFLEREEITALIQKYITLSAQEIVDSVYHDLAKLQGFDLKDDFTLMILRRRV